MIAYYTVTNLTFMRPSDQGEQGRSDEKSSLVGKANLGHVMTRLGNVLLHLLHYCFATLATW